MGASREYHSTATRRQRRAKRRARTTLVVVVTIAAILLLAWPITAVIERSGKNTMQEAPGTKGGISSDLLAPLPMQGGAVLNYAAFGPAKQTEPVDLRRWDAAAMALPACGQVDLSYFADAAFLGDSLTVGFSEFNINLSGALVCGYVGVSPKQVVNRTSLNHSQRGAEVALDVLAAAAPKKLYVLLGTNTLTALDAEEAFLAYYEEMLGLLRDALGEDCLIYVQSVPPVRPAAVETRPGLASNRIQAVNERLAKLAQEKGCCYLNLWEVLADEEGNLRAEIAEADGVHFKAGSGYTAWVNYLRAHTKYRADNPWTAGSAYAE